MAVSVLPGHAVWGFAAARDSATAVVRRWAPPPEQAEYKQVTVLFADLVGSMQLAAALGREALREVVAQVFNRSAVAVERYGGTVDKFTGDGIMALFGAPTALEDHALRAWSGGVGHPGRDPTGGRRGRTQPRYPVASAGWTRTRAR